MLLTMHLILRLHHVRRPFVHFGQLLWSILKVQYSFKYLNEYSSTRDSLSHLLFSSYWLVNRYLDGPIGK